MGIICKSCIQILDHQMVDRTIHLSREDQSIVHTGSLGSEIADILHVERGGFSQHIEFDFIQKIAIVFPTSIFEGKIQKHMARRGG